MLWLLVFFVAALGAPLSGSTGLTSHAKDLFDASMDFQDQYWDETMGYLVSADNTLPGYYDSRQTAWYAVGLAARNADGDIERCARIIENLYRSQYKDPSKIWYGDIQQTPEEPVPQEGVYEPKPYTSYDSNWRDFAGVGFVMLLEDYSDRLPADTVETLKKMLYLLAKGDQYRVGGEDGDNLYPYYTNPWLMRCLLQSYAGEYLGNQNMTDSGEKWAKEIYQLFERYETFSEFNSPTYTGVDMWALSLWVKYAPSNSSLASYAKEMYPSLMKTTKALYNANLRNFAGPFDRSYGFDMNQYVGLTASTIWGLVGRQYAPMCKKLAGCLHLADFGLGHLIALGIPTVKKYVDDDVLEAFKAYPGESSYVAQAISPPLDKYPRNITVWNSDYITIGAEEILEPQIGGPSDSAQAFNPAVIQWYVREGRIGYINLYATEGEISASAGEGYLDITYPNATGNAFTFIVSSFDVYAHDNVTSMTELPNLKLEVSGTVNTSSEIFYYDVDQSIHDFWYFNSTWTMPDNFTGIPHIHLEITEYPTNASLSI